jgi:NNP family nitrate/nitrite transporter-like MFS transporter
MPLTWRLRGGLAPFRRPASLGLIAAVGYGLNYWAWTLVGPLGPELVHRYGLSTGTLTVLAGAAVVLGSLWRIPVGALADRYGARVVLPAVSLAAAVPVAALTAVESLPEVVVAASACGVAGTAFAAGAVVVARAYPPGRRGLALSVFGAGMGVASAAGIVSRSVFAFDRNNGLLLLAAGLVGYAAVAVLLIQDAPAHARRPEPLRLIAEVLRLPAARYLSIWYAIANGGLVALDLYLPDYLGRVYHLGWATATVYAALCLGIGAVGSPVGGWLAERTTPMRVLGCCFAAVGFFALLLAFHPPLVSVAGPAGLAIAGCLGAAGGTVLCLIGRSAPIDRVGTIAGVIGAAGGLAGLVPPLLLAAVYGVSSSYGIGLTLLSVAAFLSAWHVRTHRIRLGGILTFPVDSDTRLSATAVLACAGTQQQAHLAQLVAGLGGLATRQEAVVVWRVANAPGLSLGGHALAAALRAQLPRHTVVAVEMADPPHPHEVAMIGELLDTGALPIAVVIADPSEVAIRLADELHVAQVLGVTYDRVVGVVLRPLRSGAPAI